MLAQSQTCVQELTTELRDRCLELRELSQRRQEEEKLLQVRVGVDFTLSPKKGLWGDLASMYETVKSTETNAKVYNVFAPFVAEYKDDKMNCVSSILILSKIFLRQAGIMCDFRQPAEIVHSHGPQRKIPNRFKLPSGLMLVSDILM